MQGAGWQWLLRTAGHGHAQLGGCKGAPVCPFPSCLCTGCVGCTAQHSTHGAAAPRLSADAAVRAATAAATAVPPHTAPAGPVAGTTHRPAPAARQHHQPQHSRMAHVARGLSSSATPAATSCRPSSHHHAAVHRPQPLHACAATAAVHLSSPACYPAPAQHARGARLVAAAKKKGGGGKPSGAARVRLWWHLHAWLPRHVRGTRSPRAGTQWGAPHPTTSLPQPAALHICRRRRWRRWRWRQRAKVGVGIGA